MVGFSIVSLGIGNYYFTKKNYFTAKKLYKFSLQSSLGLNARAQLRIISTDAEIRRLVQTTADTPTHKSMKVSPDQILIKGKKVLNFSNSFEQHIVLTALIRNSLEVGIPTIRIKKITLYDRNHKIVATKNSNTALGPLVSKGEFPFSLYLVLDKSKQIDVTDFDIELEIPSFVKNDRVVRLTILEQKRLSLEVIEVSGKNVYKYNYRVTLKNDSTKEISNIYRISFLKQGETILTRIGSACCNDVKFEEQNGKSSILSLDSPTYSYSLKSGESRDHQFQINSDEVLYDNSIDSDKIELVAYFIGLTK